MKMGATSLHVRPRSTLAKGIDMRTASRPKRPRERVATPAELADEQSRWERATKPAPIEGNLCRALVYFAAWRPCPACGALVLFVDERAQTDSKFTCGRCDERREALGKRWRPSLPDRVRFHLASLFSIANDNHEARA